MVPSDPESGIPRIEAPSPERFAREVVPAQEPVVFRLEGAAGGPAAWVGCDARALLRELATCAGERTVRVAELDAACGGRLSHADPAGRVPNWRERRRRFADFVAEREALEDRPDGRVLYLQSVSLRDELPELLPKAELPLLPGVPARLWAGGGVRGDTHYDQHHNVALVLAGRKRFLVFPPEELPNLYPSPLEGTHVGAPLSLVDPLAPDLERFPRFAHALARARRVELGPGDALFLPAYWWHHVETPEPSVMLNYWWSDLGARAAAAASACFWHALLTVRELPPPHRRLFASLFDTFVFERFGAPYAHLPEAQQGPAGAPTPERRRLLAERAGLAGATR